MVATVAVKWLSNLMQQDYSGIRNTLIQVVGQLGLACFD